MPIITVIKNGKKWYKWGNSGKLYPTRGAAEKQAQAAYANGYKGKKSNTTAKNVLFEKTSYPANPPQPDVILDFPELRQVFNYDCGALALQCVLTYYGFETREDQLLKLLGTESTNIKEHGTDTTAIVSVAKKFGLKAEIVIFKSVDEIKSYINKKIPVILLVQAWTDKKNVDWKTDNKDGHYVCAIGYNAENIFFEDPSSFVRTYLPNQELLDRWHDGSDVGKEIINNLGIVITGKPVFKSNEFILMR